MPQGEVVQEVRYQQVLYLAHQRQRFLSQTERVCHARHPLIKICFHRTGREDVAKRLLRMFRHRVSSQPKVIHVERQETEHQPFYFLPVPFIVGFRCAIVEAAGTVAARFLHGLDVAVQHGEELQRIHFLAFELDPDMQQVAAHRYRLPGFHLPAELGEHIGQVSVCHFILSVADGLADAVCGVVAYTRHDTAGHGGQQVTPHVEVDAVVENFSPLSGWFCSP